MQVNTATALEMKDKLNNDADAGVRGRAVKSIEVGECCVVQHDNTWYRATVLEKLESGSSVRVLMVDWGHTAVLPLSCVWDGDFALYDSAPAAIKCKLENKVDNLDKLADTQVTIRVKTFKDNTFLVRLDKRGKKESRDEVRQEVVVVHVESVNKVWIVEKNNMKKLEEMMTELSQLETVKMTDMNPGDWCCVRFSEDNELYRAQITDISEDDDSVIVQYVDYGNSEIVTRGEILNLPEKLQDTAALARPVHVKHAALALDTDHNRVKLEKSVSVDKVSMVTCDHSGAVVFYAGNNRLDLTKILGCNKKETINLFNQAECPRVSCRVSHVDQEHVWLRSGELEVGQVIQDTLQEKARRQNKAGKVHVGDLVIARFSLDRKYYRARVEQHVGSHKVEVMFIDYGNTELVETGWLKSLPGELRLCPGLAMKCSVDNNDECRMISGQEMVSLGEVTADLVQPRDMLVRLWSWGQRLGLISSGAVSPVSSSRLRLGDTWLGLLCSSSNKQLSVLNIHQALNIQSLLEYYKPDVDVTAPVEGRLYSTNMKGVVKRVMVKNMNKDVTTVSCVDTGATNKIVNTDLQLQSLSPRLQTSPAAVTSFSPHNPGKVKYMLPDTLVMVNVTDSNNITMVQVRIRVSPQFEGCAAAESVAKLELNDEKENILSVQLASGTWTSESLSQARDALLMKSLGLDHHPVTRNVPDKPSDVGEVVTEVAPIQHNNIMNLFNDASSFKFPESKIEVCGDNTKVTSHPLLPPVIFKNDSSQTFTVLTVENDQVLLQTDSRVTISSKGSTATNIELNKIYLYEDKEQMSRVSVVNIDAETGAIEVFDVDTGVEIICHQSELYDPLPEHLETPPQTLAATIVGDNKTVKPGDVATGIMKTSENDQLQLHV